MKKNNPAMVPCYICGSQVDLNLAPYAVSVVFQGRPPTPDNKVASICSVKCAREYLEQAKRACSGHPPCGGPQPVTSGS